MLPLLWERRRGSHAETQSRQGKREKRAYPQSTKRSGKNHERHQRGRAESAASAVVFLSPYVWSWVVLESHEYLGRRRCSSHRVHEEHRGKRRGIDHERHGIHGREERLIEDNSPYRVQGDFRRGRADGTLGWRMGFCHKDHIEHRTEADGSYSANENRRRARVGCSRYYGRHVVGRDERPRSSASG